MYSRNDRLFGRLWAGASRLGLGLLLAWLAVAPTIAASRTWSAPAFGGDRRWSVAANWGGTAPVNGDSLFFNERQDSSFQDECTNNLSSLQLNALFFTANQNALPDLFGNSLSLSGGISANVGFWGASVGLPITLTASQTFESLNDGRLSVSNVHVGTHTLTLDTRLGSSRIEIKGRLSGSGSVLITGPGDTTFANSVTNTFTGLVRLVDGARVTLRGINGTAGVPSVLGDLIIGDGLLPSQVTVVADHQIEGDVFLQQGSSLTLLATDVLPSLTLLGASVLTASTESLGFSGPLLAGGTSNSFIRGAVSLGSASRNVTVSNGVELAIQGPISGSNLSVNRPGLIKGGDGTLLLLSNSTFAGNVSITAGRVIAFEPLSLGAATSETLGIVNGATSVAPGGELLLSAVAITNEALTLSTTTGGLSSTGACTWAGTIGVITNVPFNISNSTLTVLGPIVGAGTIVKRQPGTLSLAGTNDNTFASAALVEAGLLLLNKSAGATAIAGNLTIGDGLGGAATDIVRVGLAEQIADTAEVTLTASGQLDLNAAETVGAIRGSGQVRLDGGDLTFGGNGTDESLSAAILGPFGLTKIGAGLQTLTGANTYTGTTRVLAGILRVNGTQPSSPVQVIGATLQGNGTVGSITCNGVLAPGAGSRGRLTCSNLTFQAGATLAIELAGTTAGTTHDQVSTRGAVQLANAALQVSLTPGYLPPDGSTFVILNNDGADAVSGTFAGLANGAFLSMGPGLRFQIRYNGGDGNDVTLTFTNDTLAVRSTVIAVGNGNPRLDPNECLLLGGSISNQTAQALTNVSVEFLPVSAGLSFSEPIARFAVIPANTAVTLTNPAVLSVASNVPCGSTGRVALVLRQNNVLARFQTVDLPIGSGGPAGCTDGGGICTYCPDVVLHGNLADGDALQNDSFTESGKDATCASPTSCPALIGDSSPRRVDSFVFQNGPRSACLDMSLENLCPSGNAELMASVYADTFNPSNLCARFVAATGTATGPGKTQSFSFQAGANQVFILTVNEFQPGSACADYRVTVRGGNCRPALALENIPGPNVRVSWPNAAAGWRPQDAGQLNVWSDLNPQITNRSGRFFFDTSGGQTSRFFRLREP